ncbi:hypothetical protein AZSI13_14300 [Azospira sp. I13]|uniref:hypothetical protein n=1 Tax=Azospira sp. I13 TaxID=1765050 RepID=UPI000D496F72|nr:hypothetical protein [Azospira sp. I13]GBG02103.1 hypothetical protein AZSI13_14300 [Azospira sp. I13]
MEAQQLRAFVRGDLAPALDKLFRRNLSLFVVVCSLLGSFLLYGAVQAASGPDLGQRGASSAQQ